MFQTASETLFEVSAITSFKTNEIIKLEEGASNNISLYLL